MAAERVRFYFEHKGDHEIVVRLEAFAEENQRIALFFFHSDGTLSLDDTQMLLDMNRDLRRLFEEADANSAEAKMHALFGQPKKASNFDETFKPLLGWDSI
jgi:hypothetical protein